jgi:hypothetical protein
VLYVNGSVRKLKAVSQFSGQFNRADEKLVKCSAVARDEERRG